jgi:hypothetical protein
MRCEDGCGMQRLPTAKGEDQREHLIQEKVPDSSRRRLRPGFTDDLKTFKIHEEVGEIGEPKPVSMCLFGAGQP